MIEPRLQYIYAVLDDNDCCTSVLTSTYIVPLDNYVLVPVFTYDYRGKYYNRETDKWYYEPEFVTEFIPE